jgi:rhamnose transport system permease protein
MTETTIETAVPETGAVGGVHWRRLFAGRDAAMIYALVVVIAVACVLIPYFASVTTVNFLLIDAIPILAIAMPMTLIIITGEIDLSVASIAGLSVATMGVLWQDQHWPIWLIVITCAIVGIVAGAVNGFLITVVGLPSLAVTIGTLALFRGLALVVIGNTAVADFPLDLTTFATSTIPGIGVPTVMILVIIVAIIFGVLLHFTPLGRSIYTIGNSPEAASFVGIRVGLTKFSLYIASGLISALVGVFWALRYSSAQSDSATGLELTVIAGVVLGGVSIFGGSGGIVGVIGGVLLIRTATYSLQLAGVSDTVLTIGTGGLRVISVVAPRAARWLRSRRRTEHPPKVIAGTPVSATNAEHQA